MVKLYQLFVQEDADETQTLSNVNMSQYCSTFFKETSLAGLPQLFKQPGILKKFFWVCGIAACFYGLYWQMDIFVKNFVSWSPNTAVTIETARQLYFPAVTICNNNPVITKNTAPSPASGTGGGAPSVGSGTNPGVSGTASGGSGTTSGTVGSGTTAASGGVTSAGSASTSASGSGTSVAGPPMPTVRRRREGIVEKIQKIPPQQFSSDGNRTVARERRQAPAPSELSQPSTRSIGTAPPRPNFAADLQTSLALLSEACKTPYSNRSSTGHLLCDMVLSCRYNGVSCAPGTNFSVWHWNPVFGNCYTFNSGYSAAGSPAAGGTDDLWTLKKGGDVEDGIRVSVIPGDTYGLYLLLNGDVEHYPSTTTQIGWRIIVHNQTEMPFPEESGFFVAPGTSSRIGISLNYVERLGKVNNGLYTADYSDCVDDGNFYRDAVNNVYSNIMEVSYSTSACLKTCYQKKVMETCKCFDFYMPSEGKAFQSLPNYDTIRYTPCAYENETLWACRDLIFQYYTTGNISCDCPETCRSYSFGTTLSFMRWPNPEATPTVCGTLKSILDSRINSSDSTCTGGSNIAGQVLLGNPYELLRTLETCSAGTYTTPILSAEEMSTLIIGKQFAEVYIYYRDFNYQTVVQSESITIDVIFANVGGVVGLFFGFSFLTFFEYVQLVVDLILIGIAKLCCKRKPQSKIAASSLTEIVTMPPQGGVMNPVPPPMQNDLPPRQPSRILSRGGNLNLPPQGGDGPAAPPYPGQPFGQNDPRNAVFYNQFYPLQNNPEQKNNCYPYPYPVPPL